MDRRNLLRNAASILFGWVGFSLWGRSALAQHQATYWAVRRVRSGDETGVLALMKSCVDDRDSFHGLCNAMEWTDTWAQGVITDRPRSIVVTLSDAIVAYFDLPSTAPKLVGDETFDRDARAFWCGAAGVRLDILGPDQAVVVFQQLLREAFSDAMSLGYESVRAAAPWDQHPYLPRPFKEYRGLTVEPFVDEKGVEKYLLEWRLVDAVDALVGAAGSPRWS